MAGFTPGTIVKLQSGGPRMTVVETLPNGEINCEWFDEKNDVQRRSFAATSLKPFTESAGRAQAGGNDPQGWMR